MDLYEYQGKQLFARYDIPVSPGEAVTTVDAAVEAAKLGHGVVEYIARLLSCDPKTIRQGLGDLEGPEDPVADRVRKKGGTPTADDHLPGWQASGDSRPRRRLAQADEAAFNRPHKLRRAAGVPLGA